jgi:hypothetical protein
VLRICLGAGAARNAARARKRLRELGIRRRVQSLDRPKLGPYPWPRGSRRWAAAMELEESSGRTALGKIILVL